MTENFPRLDYSMRKVRRAGEKLKSDIPWAEEHASEIHEIFSIANNWRDSHTFPMTKIRHELVGLVRKHEAKGIVSARLKRMHSIRKKLNRISISLSQIQDLGGCRVILPSISAANLIIDAYRNDSKHDLYNQDDYISSPKLGGYRSHHLMFKFRGEGANEAFCGRRIEVQVRSRLQHSWATAVEAVGMMRGQDMKAGLGDENWLRLFDLISAELAQAEGCPESTHLPEHADRVKEIKDLNQRLNAITTLEGLRHAVYFTDHYLQDPDSTAEYFLVTFNNATHEVTVRPFRQPLDGTNNYNLAEQLDNLHNSNTLNTVLVEAGKIANLKLAYPNYFGDVRVFAKNLKDITDGKLAKEYTMPPQAVAPRPPIAVSDMSWARRTGRKR